MLVFGMSGLSNDVGQCGVQIEAGNFESTSGDELQPRGETNEGNSHQTLHSEDTSS